MTLGTSLSDYLVIFYFPVHVYTKKKNRAKMAVFGEPATDSVTGAVETKGYQSAIWLRFFSV